MPTKKQAVKKATHKKSVKKAPTKKAVSKKRKDDELPVQLIHTGKCPTLSGRSTLTFHVGLMEGSAYLKIHSNTGGGMFSSRLWMPISDILAALEKQPKDKTVTSNTLRSLYSGRSSNDPSFAWAICVHLKLVVPDKEKKRQYRYDSPDAFLAQIDKFKAAKASK